MERLLLYLHSGSVLVGLVVVCVFFSPGLGDLTGPGRTIVLMSATADSVSARIALVRTIVTVLGVIGLLSGMVLMAMRKAERESILLAVSTIVAFLLLLYAVNLVVNRL